MQITLRLLMGFAGALPAALAAIAILYYRHMHLEMHVKLGITKGRRPPGENCSAGANYIRERIDPTIERYSNKATAFSIYHTCFTILQITYSAMIALVLMISEVPGEPNLTKIFSAILGAAVTVASGIGAACKFKERWLQYLDLRDKLFAERSVFLCAQIYDGLWRGEKNGAKYNFVEKCECVIALECRNLADNLNTPENHAAELVAPQREDTVQA